MRHVWRASGPHLYQKELVCHLSHASISSLDTRRSLVRRVSRRHVPRVACARVGCEHRRVAHDLHEAIPSWPIRLKLHLGHLARGVGRAPRHLPRSPDLACGGTSAPAHLAHLGWLREATSSKRASWGACWHLCASSPGPPRLAVCAGVKMVFLPQSQSTTNGSETGTLRVRTHRVRTVPGRDHIAVSILVSRT